MLKNFLQLSVAIILLLSRSVSAENQSLAILNFEAIGIEPEAAKVFAEHLRVELFNRELFTLLEMPDVQSKFAERGFSPDKCSGVACLTEAGKLSGADLIIGGSISKIEDSYSVTVRMIDVKNEKVARMFVYQHSGNIVSLLSEGIDTVADKLTEPAQKPEEQPAVAHAGESPAEDTEVTPGPSKPVSNPGGIGPALASCLIGPRVGLEMNEGNEEIHLSEWIALGGSIVSNSATGILAPVGHIIYTGSRAYMAYDMGGINNGIEGALAAFCIGPRIGNELHYRKIRTKEWLLLIPCINIYPLISIPLEAYHGKTMSEIEIEEGLRK